MASRAPRGWGRPDPSSVSFDELLSADPDVAPALRTVDVPRGLGAPSTTRTQDERLDAQALLSEPLLSAAQAGELLGIPRSSVYDYAKRGELPHVRVGKHVKFIRQDLERALASRRYGI